MARQNNASYEGQGPRRAKQITALDIYPVGSIYLSVNSENPSRLFGGEWELLAPGRTLVCVDVNQDAFNSSEKVGGANSNSYTHTHATQSHVLNVNELPSHNHGLGCWAIVTSGSGTPNQFDTPASNSGFQSAINAWFSGWYKGTIQETLYYGGNAGHDHGNVTDAVQSISTLQPYMTCYMWKRTA